MGQAQVSFLNRIDEGCFPFERPGWRANPHGGGEERRGGSWEDGVSASAGRLTPRQRTSPIPGGLTRSPSFCSPPWVWRLSMTAVLHASPELSRQRKRERGGSLCPSAEIPQHLLLLTAHTTLAQERQVVKPNLEGAGTCNTPGVWGVGEEPRQAWPASAVLGGVQNSKRILQTSISFCQSEIAKALLSVTTN